MERFTKWSADWGAKKIYKVTKLVRDLVPVAEVYVNIQLDFVTCLSRCRRHCLAQQERKAFRRHCHGRGRLALSERCCRVPASPEEGDRANLFRRRRPWKLDPMTHYRRSRRTKLRGGIFLVSSSCRRSSKMSCADSAKASQLQLLAVCWVMQAGNVEPLRQH